MNLESKNILLKSSTMSDCRYFEMWETDDEIASKYAMSDKRNYEEIVRELILAEKQPDKINLTIFQKESAMPIGRILVTRIDTYNDALDISRLYIGDRTQRRKGYAEEAMHLMLNYAFLQLHMERVTVDYEKDDVPSGHFLEKFGFTEEGIARNMMKRSGRYHDRVIMSMLRAEYYSKIHRENE